MTDGHLQGRQKLRAASRAGAAAPGPSGPAPALPARGGRPSGQARLAGAAGSVGLGHRPEETRAPVAKRTKNHRNPARPPAPQVQRPALGLWHRVGGAAASLARPGALEGGRRGTKRLAVWAGRPAFRRLRARASRSAVYAAQGLQAGDRARLAGLPAVRGLR